MHPGALGADHDVRRALAAGAVPGTQLNLIGVILAGTAGNVAGSLPWTTALAVAGYAVGANWESIVTAFHGPSYVIAGIVLAAIVLAAWRYARRRQAEPSPRRSMPG